MAPGFVTFFLIAFFILSLVFSLLINRLFLKFSSTLGTRQNGELIRWSPKIKPSVGGISFYIIYLFSVTVFLILKGNQQLVELNFLGQLSAITIAFIIGLADDAYNTNPLGKFLGQMACGLVLTFTGTTIHLFETETLNHILTVFWVIALMNSLNMLDNMDGITAVVSISIIATIILCLLSMPMGSLIDLTILLGALGAVLGFLFYNWNPSKMFMGDTGSQFIGCFLAIYSIIYLWNFELNGNHAQTKQLVIVGLTFLIPLTDTATVTINRLLKGSSPFVGGKDHTTHHLSYLGFSDKQVAWLFILISMLSLFFVYVIINFITNWNYMYFTIFAFYILLVALGLYLATRLKRKSG